MKSTIHRLVGIAVLALSTALGAQAPQAPAPQAPPAPPGTKSQPTFRVAIDFVTTDVIARNSQDQFVADLTKDDFEIFEDGVKQDITSLTLVHGGRVHNLGARRRRRRRRGIILPVSRPRNDTAGRIFLIIVDDLHLDFRNTGRIRDLFKRISKTLVHEGDMFSIVSTGPSSLAIDPTYDRKVLDEAIKKITGNGLKPSDIIQGAEGADGPSEVRYRAHVAFSTAYDMLTQMEKINNRRKAVIWVSNGYDFNPFAESRLGEDPVFGGRFGQTREEGKQQQGMTGQNQFADADLARELAEITRTANRANATLYTIDPRGLVAGTDLDETARSGGVRRARPQDAGQPARAGRADRRHRRRQPEQLRQGAEADRRRDERLLHARLFVDQPGSAEADPQDRGEAGEPAGRQRVVADVVFAAAAADKRRNSARRDRRSIPESARAARPPAADAGGRTPAIRLRSGRSR